MKGKFARTITVVATGGLLVAGSGGVASASPAGRQAAASSQAIPRRTCPPGPLGAIGGMLDSLLDAVTGLVDGVLDPPHVP